jgi:hypothetical protein
MGRIGKPQRDRVIDQLKLKEIARATCGYDLFSNFTHALNFQNVIAEKFVELSMLPYTVGSRAHFRGYMFKKVATTARRRLLDFIHGRLAGFVEAGFRSRGGAHGEGYGIAALFSPA